MLILLQIFLLIAFAIMGIIKLLDMMAQAADERDRAAARAAVIAEERQEAALGYPKRKAAEAAAAAARQVERANKIIELENELASIQHLKLTSERHKEACNQSWRAGFAPDVVKRAREDLFNNGRVVALEDEIRRRKDWPN